jgi:hypothetical protein
VSSRSVTASSPLRATVALKPAPLEADWLRYHTVTFGLGRDGQADGTGISFDAPADWLPGRSPDARIGIFTAPGDIWSLHLDARAAIRRLGTAIADRTRYVQEARGRILNRRDGRLASSAWSGRPLAYRTMTAVTPGPKGSQRLILTRWVTTDERLTHDSQVVTITVVGRPGDQQALGQVLQRATGTLMIVGG